MSLLDGPVFLTSSETALATSTNLLASAEEIQEKWRRPGSIPIYSISSLNRVNFLLA
jgi:hypothetical protein